MSLAPLILSDEVARRASPIGFWRYDRRTEAMNARWMDPRLTRGTTPTTRNPGIDFVNFRHPVPKTSDFGGIAAWTGDRFKLVRSGERSPELYDLAADPGERRNLAGNYPGRVASMYEQLAAWQRSVERSLAGLDY